ncbi:hypothetical protein LWI29_020108 [Acer saccharum]|uniref:Uncharacterized protein n=1 Tax=Acer saccharum TaxID=4024 RepID=A0AA39VKS2_ACESA|nr:hypothetical protein LWI29_020108 [Acer saccharum]
MEIAQISSGAFPPHGGDCTRSSPDGGDIVGDGERGGGGKSDNGDGEAHIVIEAELFLCSLEQALEFRVGQECDGDNVSASVFADVDGEVVVVVAAAALEEEEEEEFVWFGGRNVERDKRERVKSVGGGGGDGRG